MVRENVFGLRMKSERKMEIRISEKEILSGDISQVKTLVDKFALDSRLSAENQNNISIKFDSFSPFDLSIKLQEQAYKSWFKKLDNEFQYLPFFLNRQSKTLLFFIMGNTDFTIENHNIVFNEASKQHYISNKKSSIKAFCLTHNIDPKSAIQNLISFEPTPQKPANQKVVKIKIDDYLNKFGAITILNEQRELNIWLATSDIPSNINILGAYYIKNCPQPFFSVFIQQNGDYIEYKAIILASATDIEEFCKTKSSIEIIIVFKNGNEYQACPGLEKKFETLSPEELEERRKEVINYTENSAEKEGVPYEPEEVKDEEETPDQSEDLDKTLPLADVDEVKEIIEKIEEKTEKEPEEEPEETAPQDETLEEKVARLEKEIARLREKTASQKKIIEDLEEEINKKRSFWSILKGLFK